MVIDPNEISPNEDLISPERLAKGDLMVARNMRGKVHRAIPAQLTVIKELIRRELLQQHVEIYAIGFLELRAAFRAPWAVRSSAVLLEQWGIGISNSKADSIYQNVCRRVGKENVDIIEYVVEKAERRLSRGVSSGYGGKERRKDHTPIYISAFSKLTMVMDEEREKAQEEAKRS